MPDFGPRIDVRPVFERDREALLAQLRDLGSDDWVRTTAAAPWTVRDVVAHVVGDDLNRLSRSRDGHQGPGFAPGETLPVFLHRINDEWVRATARISPRALVDVLSVTTPRVLEYWASTDLDVLGEPVTWAGPDPAPVWLDCARDFTEYWTHQQQIREAVARPGPDDQDSTRTALDVFLRAVPTTLDDDPGPDGVTLAVQVDGASGGRWRWRRVDGAWRHIDSEGEADTVVRFPDAGPLWRLCVRMREPDDVAGLVTVTGDRETAERLLRIVAIIR